MSAEALFSIDSEKAVLACMMLWPKECIDEAVSHLKASDFVLDDLQWAFSFLSAHYALGGGIDLVTVTEASKNAGWYKDAEEKAQAQRYTSFWVEIIAGHGIPSLLPRYIAIVKESSARRRLHALGETIQKKALAGDSLGEIVTYMEREQEAIFSGWEASGWSGDRPWDDYHKLVTTPPDNSTSVLATGFGSLDEIVKMRGSYMVTLAGVQKSGKSTKIKDWAIRFWDQGIPGEIISLEMKLPDYQTLIISSVTGIARDDLEARNLRPEQIDKMMLSLQRVKKWPWTIHDPHRMNTTQFRALAKEAARKGAKFLVLDYFQLMDCDGGPRERHLQLAEISRSIKQTALETGLLIIVGSQLNQKQLAPHEKPGLSHLRGTGGLAEDSDIVILMHEPEPDPMKLPPRGMTRVEVAVEANRRGAKSDLEFYLDGPHARFIEKIS